MSDMMLELGLLRLLHGNPPMRSSALGKLVEKPGKEVLQALKVLKSRGHVECDMNQRWNLSAGGLTYYNQLRSKAGQNRTARSRPFRGYSPGEDGPVREEIKNLPPEDCVVVNAGPGMGKTHLACERIAALVDERQIPPERILVISFSRAAVSVMRERSQGFVGFERLEIRTLDSLSAALHGETPSHWDYDRSIERALELEDLWAPLLEDRYSHVILDEAQDIIGPRAELVSRLLFHLVNNGVGFTLFHDPAQAIYDFTDGEKKEDTKNVLACLEEEGLLDGVQEQKLTTVHRSSEEEHLDLMHTVRTLTLREASADLDCLASTINSCAIPFKSEEHENIGGELWLFRSRHEAVHNIYHARQHGVPVRLQMGDVRVSLDPAIAHILNSTPGPLIEECDVLRFTSAGTELPKPLTPARAAILFESMRRHAPGGKDAIDVQRLTSILARGDCPPEGLEAPPYPAELTLSVIHSAKGSEADHVRYFVHEQKDLDPEEARVIHVAISRARERLTIHASKFYMKSFDYHGRRWVTQGKKKRFLVHGLDDVDPFYSLGVFIGEDSGIQERLASFEGVPRELSATFDGSRYVLTLKDEDGECTGEVVGALSHRVNDDIERKKKHRHTKTWQHRNIGGLHLIGVSAIVTDRGRSPGQPLKAPYHETRTWLAPVVAGLCWSY